MIDIDDKVILNDWYIVARSAEILRGRLYQVTLLEHDVLLWRTIDGSLNAWEDRCPHRGAALSLGKALDGDIVACPYHGWQFGRDAHCVKMPALPERTPSARIRVATYPVCEYYGYVWISLGNPLNAVPHLAEPANTLYHNHLFGPFRFATSPGRAIENFLDMAHFPFVHPGLLGAEPYTEVKDYQVETSAGGLIATHCYFAQPHAASHIQGMSDVNYTYKVLRPYLAYLTKNLPGREHDDAMLLAATPLTEESCNVWVIWAQHYPDETIPSVKTESEHWTLEIILQDLPIVNSQKPKRLPLTLTDEFHQPCDKMALAYRRWLTQLGVRYGTLAANNE
jgi:phenylpropionate dioxygenase-like ring-hydroxylating dioxygenase large terminal subunit